MTLAQQTLQTTKIIILALLFAAGISLVHAAFVGPTAPPPQENTPAPINVSLLYQEKAGDFWARTIGTDNGYCIGTNCITDWPSGADTDWTESGGNVYRSTGNVGIGTASPNGQLEISANVDTPLLRLTNPGDLEVDFRIDAADNDFHIDTNVKSDAIVIDGPTGNVGIGTASPGRTLDVQATVASLRVAPSGSPSSAYGVVIRGQFNAANFFNIETPDGKNIIKHDRDGADVNSLFFGHNTAQFKNLIFVNDFGEVFRADANGRVGIGTASPGKTLSVVGPAGDAILVDNKITGAGSSLIFDTESSGQIVFREGGTEAMRIDSSGRVGIGNTNPGQKLDVTGYVKGRTGLCIAGDCRTSWPSGGDMTPSGAVMAFNLSSCPTGWSEFTQARGRYIVGLPSGGTLGGTAGTILSNLENRPAGKHDHRFRVHWSGFGGKPAGGWGSYSKADFKDRSGLVPGTNAPYIQLLFCQKN